MSANMKNDILSLIDNVGGGVSFAELNRSVPGFSGHLQVGLHQNTILWGSISKEGDAAIAELIAEGLIGYRQTSMMTYLIDGSVLNLPIAKDHTEKYKEAHWLPITFSRIPSPIAKPKAKTKTKAKVKVKT